MNTKKLILLCFLGLCLFTFGTVRYFTKYYNIDAKKCVQKALANTQAMTQTMIDSSLCSYDRGEDVQGEYYIHQALLYYHKSDSLVKVYNAIK